MSDTPRMDSAFNQPTSTTPRRNWQPDQCYREGCKLERELAAVTEQRDMLAEAIRKHRDELELTSGDSVDRILWNALSAMEGGSDE